MCPACLASAALAAGGVVSSGGIAALAAKVLGFKRNRRGDVSDDMTKRRRDNGNSDRQETGDGRAAG